MTHKNIFLSLLVLSSSGNIFSSANETKKTKELYPQANLLGKKNNIRTALRQNRSLSESRSNSLTDQTEIQRLNRSDGLPILLVKKEGNLKTINED